MGLDLGHTIIFLITYDVFMKRCITILYFLILLINTKVLAQVYHMQQTSFKNFSDDILDNIDKMGVNDDSLLTELEGKYFNTLYKLPKENFNLSGKKVAFFTGSLGKTKSNKRKYFAGERERLQFSYSPNFGTLYIFNATQKEENGGYDAAIVYWCKFMLSVNDVMKNMNKK